MSYAVAQEKTAPALADVVVIDDDNLTLEIVEWALRGSKTRHRLFTDADIAMTYLCESLPRILIVDYYMPRINGIEFIRQLGARVDLAFCSIYLCSSIEPGADQLQHLHELRIKTLDKTVICDRSLLTALLESEHQLTGNQNSVLH